MLKFSTPENPDSCIKKAIQKAKKGDRSAFDEIYRHFSGQLLSIVRWRLNKRDFSDQAVEDICQDTWIVAYQRISGGFQPDKGEFFSWLCGIAIYLAHNWGRKKENQHRNHVPLEDCEPLLSWDSAVYRSQSVTEPTRHIEGEDRRRILMQIINELPEKYSSVLTDEAV